MRIGFKRALCILTALTVAFTCLTAVGFSVSAQGSDDYFTYTVNGDEATITGYTRGILGTLEIPGEIDGFRVTAIGDSAFVIRERMKKVVLPQSIERIECSAFSNCTALEEIVFPENGNISIDRYAFYDCTSLEELYIPSSVKSIGESAFENCRALKKVNYNAVCVEGYNMVFEGCNEISQVTLGDAVKDMPIFSETKIKSITLPQGVTEIPYRAFYGCTELEQITALGEITSSYQADGVNGSFYGTPFLENPANRENGVLYLGKAIIDADESVDYGNYTVKEGTVSISEYAFYGCEKLTGITVPESVEEIGSYAFYNTAWNNEANYENGVLYAGDIAVKGLSSWSKIIIKDSVKSIADGAFKYCNMTDLTVPASVKKIGCAVFVDCENIENVYFEGTADQWCAIDFESAGSCPAAYAENLYFEGQPAVNVTLTQGVESIPAYAFSSELIESISIPSSVKSIGEGAFCRSRKLRSVEIADGVETIGAYAFEHCDSLKEIVLPDSVKEIGGRCFADSAIEKITLSDSLEIIPDRAFMDSTVKEIEWGDIVRKIDERAFLSCYKLEELRFPDSLEEIA